MGSTASKEVTAASNTAPMEKSLITMPLGA
jgi:hypothetical protein